MHLTARPRTHNRDKSRLHRTLDILEEKTLYALTKERKRASSALFTHKPECKSGAEREELADVRYKREFFKGVLFSVSVQKHLCYNVLNISLRKRAPKTKPRKSIVHA